MFSSKLTSITTLLLSEAYSSSSKYISLGNLIVDRQAFRELIQEDFNPDAVTAELARLTGDNDYRSRMLADYADIRAALGGAGASRSVAKAMIESLTETND